MYQRHPNGAHPRDLRVGRHDDVRSRRTPRAMGARAVPCREEHVMADHEIKITVSAGQVRCKPSSCDIEDSETVEWYTPGGEPWAIEMQNASAFNKRRAWGNGKGSPNGTLKAKKQNKKTTYKYLVSCVKAGRVYTADPDIVIRPGGGDEKPKKPKKKKAAKKKASVKKSAARKSAARKAPAKKSAARKSAARETPAKKSAAKKSATRKTTTRKPAARKASAKKAAPKKSREK